MDIIVLLIHVQRHTLTVPDKSFGYLGQNITTMTTFCSTDTSLLFPIPIPIPIPIP